MIDTRTLAIRRLSAYAIVLLIVAGCAAPTPPPPPPPAATSDTSERSFDEAVNVATDGLMSQLQQRQDPSAKAAAKRGVMIDPMVDAASGQQTGATRLLEQRVGERIQSNHPQFEVMPFQVGNLSKAQYLVTGTMTRIASAQTGARQVFQIDLAATDLKTGTVGPGVVARATRRSITTRPPTIATARSSSKTRLSTATSTPPRRRPVSRRTRSTSSVWPPRPLSARPQPPTTTRATRTPSRSTGTRRRRPRVNSCACSTGSISPRGSSVAPPRREEAFGRVVALGLSNNNLGVKFLFNPRSTDFWADRQVSGPYGFWLRQIAAPGGIDEGVHERSRPHQPDRIPRSTTTASRSGARPTSSSASTRRHPSSPGAPTHRAWASGRTSWARGPTTRVTRSTGESSSRSPTADQAAWGRPEPYGIEAASSTDRLRRGGCERQGLGGARAPH